MNVWTAYAMIWLSCALVTIVAMVVSQSLLPLWIMVVPLFFSPSSSSKKEE